MDIPFVPDDPPPPPNTYNFKKKKSQYGQRKNQSSSAVSHHQGVENHHPLASDVLSDALLPNEDPYQTPNTPRADDNWRTTRAVLSVDNIIQDETLKSIAVDEIIVQEMAKRVAAEDKDRDSMREESMLSARHGRRNMRPIFSYRIKRRRLMILRKTHSL